MVCGRCGATNDADGQRFCYNCGASLSATAAPAAPPLPAYGLPDPGHLAPAAPQVPTNSALAVTSLVAGILSLVFFFIPLISALVAVICGHLARREIRASGGRLAGDGIALIGLVLGYISLSLTALGICGLLAYFIIVAGAAA